MVCAYDAGRLGLNTSAEICDSNLVSWIGTVLSLGCFGNQSLVLKAIPFAEFVVEWWVFSLTNKNANTSLPD